MTGNAFQYVTSNDMGVIEAIRNRMAATADLHARAVAFSARYGTTDGGYFRDDFGGDARVTAIDGDKPSGFGQWKRGRRGWVPYKNNPLYADFAKLNAGHVPIPGVPAFLYGATHRDGSQSLYSPHPFLYDGSAWVGIGGAPERQGTHEEGYGPQWVECLPSKFHLALEGYNADRKKPKL